MAERTCSIDGCDRPAGVPGTARGWCSAHYSRWQRYGDPLGERPLTNKGKVCAADDCDLPARTKGWCSKHYTRLLRYGDATKRMPGEVVDGKRICPLCGEDKPWTAECFHANGARPEGLSIECKACVCRRRRETRDPAQARAYAVENRDKFAAATRRWRQRNPDQVQMQTRLRRSRRQGVPSEPFTRAEIAERDGWRCQICGAVILPIIRWPHPRSLSIDHVIPLSKGGHDTRENVQASHLRCNLRKHASHAP